MLLNVDVSWEDMQSNNLKPISKQQQVLKCKSCRFLLISEPEDLLYHASDDPTKDCGLIYLRPFVEWIPIEENVIQGKIECPKCQCNYYFD